MNTIQHRINVCEVTRTILTRWHDIFPLNAFKFLLKSLETN